MWSGHSGVGVRVRVGVGIGVGVGVGVGVAGVGVGVAGVGVGAPACVIMHVRRRPPPATVIAPVLGVVLVFSSRANETEPLLLPEASEGGICTQITAALAVHATFDRTVRVVPAPPDEGIFWDSGAMVKVGVGVGVAGVGVGVAGVGVGFTVMVNVLTTEQPSPDK